MTYTHRNGETEPPTEAGEYWFIGEVYGKWLAEKVDVRLRGKGFGASTSEGSYEVSEFRGSRWWGPIIEIPPWTEEQAAQYYEETKRRWDEDDHLSDEEYSAKYEQRSKGK